MEELPKLRAYKFVRRFEISEPNEGGENLQTATTDMVMKSIHNNVHLQTVTCIKEEIKVCMGSLSPPLFPLHFVLLSLK